MERKSLIAACRFDSNQYCFTDRRFTMTRRRADPDWSSAAGFDAVRGRYKTLSLFKAAEARRPTSLLSRKQR